MPTVAASATPTTARRPGAEIGCRGYMLTRLIDSRPVSVLVSGLLWGLWHLPLVFAGVIYVDHPSAFMAAAAFLVSAVGAGYVLARARLRAGSIRDVRILGTHDDPRTTTADPSQRGESLRASTQSR